MASDFDDQLMTEYLARSPSHANSREIVKELSDFHKLTEAKVRSTLIKLGVYIAQPRISNAPTLEQKRLIFERLNAAPKGLYITTNALAKDFSLTWDATFKIEQEWREGRVARQAAATMTTVSPIYNPGSEYKSEASGRTWIISGLSVAVVIFFFVIYSLSATSLPTVSRSSSFASSSSQGAATARGTAADEERAAYSVDAYKKPISMTPQEDRDYQRLSKEGQEYTDEKMAEYDRACAAKGGC